MIVLEELKDYLDNFYKRTLKKPTAIPITSKEKELLKEYADQFSAETKTTEGNKKESDGESIDEIFGIDIYITEDAKAIRDVEKLRKK